MSSNGAENVDYSTLTEEQINTRRERALTKIAAGYDKVRDEHKLISVEAKKNYALLEELRRRTAEAADQVREKRKGYEREAREDKKARTEKGKNDGGKAVEAVKVEPPKGVKSDVGQSSYRPDAVAYATALTKVSDTEKAKILEELEAKKAIEAVQADIEKQQEQQKIEKLKKANQELDRDALLEQIRLLTAKVENKRSGRRLEEDSC